MQKQIESQAAEHQAKLTGARDRHHRRRRPRSRKTNANATDGPSASSGPTPWPRVRTAPASGCFTAVTTQMLNHLINADQLTFCKSCGRLLYMDEHEEAACPKRVKAQAADADPTGTDPR